RTIEMLESPAYQVLSLHAHRILARLEIEHAHHGGNDNGRLPCTYDHFEEYGVRRKAIKSALRELEGLGFIEITEKSRAGNSEWRRPNHFRLTYRYLGRAAPTDEWKRVKSREQAEMIAEQAWATPERATATRYAPTQEYRGSGDVGTMASSGDVDTMELNSLVATGAPRTTRKRHWDSVSPL